ncbi:MAG: hypothetical protein ABI318_20800 [Chthoniobacteraceae bacterium]
MDAPAPRGSAAGRSSGSAATLDAILRDTYRRHARGRVAREAVAACLGR